MSRMSAQKDPETLYRAFAAAAAERPDIHLFHVGTGELEAILEAAGLTPTGHAKSDSPFNILVSRAP